jgi:hypothetical protein
VCGSTFEGRRRRRSPATDSCQSLCSHRVCDIARVFSPRKREARTDTWRRARADTWRRRALTRGAVCHVPRDASQSLASRCPLRRETWHSLAARPPPHLWLHHPDQLLHERSLHTEAATIANLRARSHGKQAQHKCRQNRHNTAHLFELKFLGRQIRLLCVIHARVHLPSAPALGVMDKLRETERKEACECDRAMRAGTSERAFFANFRMLFACQASAYHSAGLTDPQSNRSQPNRRPVRANAARSAPRQRRNVGKLDRRKASLQRQEAPIQEKPVAPHTHLPLVVLIKPPIVHLLPPPV